MKIIKSFLLHLGGKILENFHFYSYTYTLSCVVESIHSFPKIYMQKIYVLEGDEDGRVREELFRVGWFVRKINKF
jgi:hypothetical protein